MATFCMLHGDWHDRFCWEPLVECLTAAGHNTVAPNLPYDDPEAGYEERIRPAMQALDGVAGSVVVVGHSASSGYAALIAAKHPGSLLVHLCPRLGQFPSPPGAPNTFRKGFPFPPKRADGAMVWDPQDAIDAMYPRLPAEIARMLAERLRPAAPPPAGEYPLLSHPNVRTVLIYATEDEIFEPAWQRFMAHELLGIEPVEISGGHFPMLEDPMALADLLGRLEHQHMTGQLPRQGRNPSRFGRTG
jgi:pimeloyl-ACP methyl ester carboxylesterase